MRVMTQHAHYSQLPRHLVPQSPPSLTASPTFPLWSWQVTTSPLQSIRTSPPVFSPPHRRACTARGSGEVGAGGAAVGQPGRQGGCNVSLFSRTPGAVIYYRVFDTAAGSAAACNTSHTDYSRYPGGGGFIFRSRTSPFLHTLQIAHAWWTALKFSGLGVMCSGIERQRQSRSLASRRRSLLSAHHAHVMAYVSPLPRCVCSR